MNIVIFADKKVGKEAVSFLFKNYFCHLNTIVCTNENSEVFLSLTELNFPLNRILFNDDLKKDNFNNRLFSEDIDYIILAWWPYIVKNEIISIPKIGTINFHPSFLPFNRGKHYNFWTIVEQSPFGVSIHFVDNSIDGGDIIFQKRIEKTWEDTGETLYHKAQRAMIDLFIESYPKLISGNFIRIKQDLTQGTFHYGKELDAASLIELNKEYKAIDLLNLLRARTFKGFPACYFFDQGIKYEIHVEIRRSNE